VPTRAYRVALAVARLRRVARKPPRVIAARFAQEALGQLERFRGPRRAAMLDEVGLLDATASSSIDELWERVAARSLARHVDGARHAAAYPADVARVIEAAERAVGREVDQLGSGPIVLGRPIDWHRDFKTGHAWPLAYGRSIDYVNLDRPSDVKIPWELSRLQWLLPAGQAYLLTRDERYAVAAREVIDEWLASNPYAFGVNWALAMEAAMRVFTWSWLIGALHESDAWAEKSFRLRLLQSLYLHGDFIERHLERSDVNGNHYTADAAGMLVAGLLFAPGEAPHRWAQRGWSILQEEQRLQVLDDGVDFEGSSAYHRLVGELFVVASLAREAAGLETPEPYRERLRAMARFVAAYTRPDGSAPNWGDADDARVLPLGGEDVNDHRHLIGSVAAAWPGHVLSWASPRDDAAVAWLVGLPPIRTVSQDEPTPESVGFPEGGLYVLAAAGDHVFVDCGPVGLAGRGGHGHNDCLSFEAVLDGVHLVADPGSFVYTASLEERNRFRSTASHNTPIVDGAEQNRLDPALPWNLANDAEPSVLEWRIHPERVLLRASHSGFMRLARPVRPVRTFVLESSEHVLSVRDEFDGEGDHEIRIPLHLARGVAAREARSGEIQLDGAGRAFVLRWTSDADWQVVIRADWLSPSYGVRHETTVIEWIRSGPLCPLEIVLRPASG
jgi:uncharacterized heparinase superfamily protein